MSVQQSKRNNRIMMIFDIEKNYQKHKQKLLKIKNKNAFGQVQKTYKSQLDIINSYRKNYLQSETLKQKQQAQEVAKANRALHYKLNKQYSRSSKENVSRMVSQSRVLSSARSTKSQNGWKSQLVMDNKRMLERIVRAQSTINRKSFLDDYKRNKTIKKRLMTLSVQNQSRTKVALKRMKVVPRVYFPTIKN